jgi:hypothetical protein
MQFLIVTMGGTYHYQCGLKGYSKYKEKRVTTLNRVPTSKLEKIRINRLCTVYRDTVPTLQRAESITIIKPPG